MSASNLDPKVCYALQEHLMIVHHKSSKGILELGTLENVQTAAKISTSDEVSACFDQWTNDLKRYPMLPSKNYLVACVDRWAFVKVYGIYSFEQMKQMHEMRKSGGVRHIDWKVLEIPDEIEKSLLEDVDFENGVIVT